MKNNALKKTIHLLREIKLSSLEKEEIKQSIFKRVFEESDSDVVVQNAGSELSRKNTESPYGVDRRSAPLFHTVSPFFSPTIRKATVAVALIITFTAGIQVHKQFTADVEQVASSTSSGGQNGVKDAVQTLTSQLRSFVNTLEESFSLK